MSARRNQWAMGKSRSKVDRSSGPSESRLTTWGGVDDVRVAASNRGDNSFVRRGVGTIYQYWTIDPLTISQV